MSSAIEYQVREIITMDFVKPYADAYFQVAIDITDRSNGELVSSITATVQIPFDPNMAYSEIESLAIDRCRALIRRISDDR